MVASYSLVFVSLLTSLVSASPAPVNHAITIPISRKSQPNLSHKERALLGARHTYLKYASLMATPDSFAATTAASASLLNGNNELYVCNVTVGNGQVLPLDLDTGSSDTWVRGKGCTSTDGSCLDTLSHVDASDSTLVNTGKTFKTNYGSGSVSGNIYTAPVSIAGLTAHIPIGISTAEVGFSDGFQSGLMGMGYNAISTIGSTVGTSASFFDGLGFTGAKNMFSFYLSNQPNNGEITLGGYDSTKFTGPITWIPLNSETYFQFSLKGFSVSVNGNKQSISGWFNEKNAIADTGTTLMLFQDGSIADNINKYIGAGAYNATEGVYDIPCSVATTGPDVVVAYNGVNFPIPASIYVFPTGDGKTCFSGISKTPAVGPLGLLSFMEPSILGDVFLRAFYSIYDKNQNRVGFAKSIQ